jgi:histidinol dehydrogenase
MRDHMKIYEYGKDDLNRLYYLLKQRSLEGQRNVDDVVSKILQDVVDRGDEALFEYTEKFDGVKLNSIEITEKEMDEALEAVDDNLLEVIQRASENIRIYHEKQRENSWFITKENGIVLGQKITPLKRVGVYAPAGSAPLPSTVLMDVIPAKIAGVEEIILCSPPGKDGKMNPLVLACARLAGVDRAFKLGGAQAVAAMAYGTQSVPKVDKIVGPGNIYVATAKKQVFGVCGIDMIAGPSEILVIADETADPAYVAADLLSQAEHDRLASSILVTTSKETAYIVAEEVKIQLNKLERKEIASKSIEGYGAIIIANNMEEAIEIANTIAPEHLEVCTIDPFSLLDDIKNAGAIFLGNYSPEPLGVYDFVKRQSVISYSKKAFDLAAADVSAFADAEGLTAHRNAVRIRTEVKGRD